MPHVSCGLAEEFYVFGHAAHLKLKEGEAILDRGELFEEPFLRKLLFRERPFDLVVSIGTTSHDDAPCVAPLAKATRSADALIFRPPDAGGSMTGAP